MDRETATLILDRLAKATGADREIDEAIATAFNEWDEHYEAFDQHSKPELVRNCDDYTASIDAALALVERVKPGRYAYALINDYGGYNRAEINDSASGETYHGIADTMPIAILVALTTALLRAEMGT
jgi:hypothetical protein